jgi:hypothetical protein
MFYKGLRRLPAIVLLVVIAASVPENVAVQIAGESDEPASQTVRSALAKRISVEFVGTPLGNVLRQLEAKIGVAIVADQEVLENIEVSLDEKINLTVRNVTARNVLRIICRPLNASIIPQRGRILVTAFDRTYVTRRYSTLGLVLLDPQIEWRGTAEPLARHVSDILREHDGCDIDIDEFGTYAFDEEAQELVVRAKRATHEEIERMFAALRTSCERFDDLLRVSGLPDAKALRKVRQPRRLLSDTN